MRILVLSGAPLPAPRGSQLLVLRQAAALAARGHEVHVVAPAAGRDGAGGEVLGFRFHPAGAAAPRSRPEARRAAAAARLAAVARRVAAAAGPHVALAHNLDAALVAAVALRRVPWAYVRHTDPAAELRAWGGAAARLAPAAAALERAARRAAALAIELGAEPALGPERAIVPPPCDPAEPPVEPTAPGEGPVLLYEGNLDPYQNPAWLGLALARVRARWPAARLHVAGHPGERPPRADVALLPRTLAAGFPMKLLAYQVAGVPVVAARPPAGTRHGVDLWSPPGADTPEGFAAAVVGLLERPATARALAARARARALRRHDPGRAAAALEAALEEAIRRWQGRRGVRIFARPRRIVLPTCPHPEESPR